MNVQCPASRLIALAVLCLLACVNDGLAAEPMQYPLAVAVTDDGTIYVADLKLPGIWEIREGTRREYFRGSKKFCTPLNAVRCLAIDHEGRLLAGDSATREVYRFDADAKPQPLTDGKLGIPAALAVDAEGIIFVSDLETRRVWKVPAAGGEPVEVARIAGVRGMAFAEDGSLVVATALAPQVRKVAPDGTVTPVVTGRPLKFPQHLAITKTGAIYIADNYSAGLWKLAEDGTPELWKTGKPFVRPVGLTAADDVLYLADPHARSLFRVDQAGKVSLIDGPPAADAGVDSSTGDAAQ